MRLIVFTNDIGGVSVTYPANDISTEEVKAKDTPEHSVIINASDLPEEDNDFFNAWELNGSTVSVNLTKAKEITKDRLREERIPLLQIQDVLFQRALEANVDTSAIVAEKQRLRDITSLADTCLDTIQLRMLKAANDT